MPTPRELVLNYQRTGKTLREKVDRQAVRLWNAADDYREAEMRRFAAEMTLVVAAAQRAAAGRTDLYLASAAHAMPHGVTDRLVVGAAPRFGIPPAEVYLRPAKTVYKALAEDKPLREAVKLGERRLRTTVATDIQLATRVQEQESLKRYGRGYDYYRRVLTGDENCALCVIAATQRYTVGDLKPIHPGCDCGCEQVRSAKDPGQILNQELLEATHDLVNAEVASRDPRNRDARDLGIEKTDSRGNPVSDYTDLIVVRNHGEYGPTLAWRNDRFTGPGDIAA